MTDSQSTYQQRVNRVALRDLSITHSACAAGLHLKFTTSDTILQRVCVAGAGSATSGQIGTDLDTRRWSAITPALEGGSLNVRSDYAELRVAIDSSVLKRKVGVLLGDAPVDHIALVADNDVKSPALSRFRRLLSFVLSEIEMGGPTAPGPILDELGEALLISLLHAHKHNFSHRLMQPEAVTSSAQHRRVEELIASRWNESLSIDDMVSVAEVSARSIFRKFQELHGCSPLEYVKRVRLQHAQQMLLKGTPHTTVTGVALKCGFQSLGHFASSYRRVFCELPSETPLRARR